MRFAQLVSHVTGRPIAFIGRRWRDPGLGAFRAALRLQRHLAARDQHGTTIITFLMVFVIQNTQNRDTAAMQIKIDELIRVTSKARNVLLDLEELDDKTLETLRQDYEKLGSKESAKPGGKQRRRGQEPAGRESQRRPVARGALGIGRIRRVSRSASTRRSRSRTKAAGAALLLDGKPVRTPGKAPLGAADARAGRGGRRGMARARRAHRSRRPCRSPSSPTASSTACTGNEEAVIDDIMAPCRLRPALLPRGRAARALVGAAGTALGPGARLGQGRARRAAHACRRRGACDAAASFARPDQRAASRVRCVQPRRAACDDRGSPARPCWRWPWRLGGLRRRRRGRPPMSMRTGRSANGARTPRPRSGARVAGATSPPPRSCFDCCGADQVTSPHRREETSIMVGSAVRSCRDPRPCRRSARNAATAP